MMTKMPFNIDDFLLTDVNDVDFDDLEDDNLFALIAEYGSTNPLLASFALIELVARSQRNEALKARAVPALAAIVKNNKVDEDFYGSALTNLYRLDRPQGQAEIARVIESRDHYTVHEVAGVLGYDIELYKGDPVFDKAVAKVAKCLKEESQNDRALRDDEIYFLRNAGYPVVPTSDLDEQDRDVGVFRGYDARGDFVGSIVERVSNGADVIRVEPLRLDGSTLVVPYEIVELGISHARARQLIHRHLLVELYEDTFRVKARDVLYHDILKDSSELRTYDSP